ADHHERAANVMPASRNHLGCQALQTATRRAAVIEMTLSGSATREIQTRPRRRSSCDRRPSDSAAAIRDITFATNSGAGGTAAAAGAAQTAAATWRSAFST